MTSVDQDGTCTGPDEALIEKASKVSQVPLVVGGGFGNRDQIQKAFEKSDVSAVSLGAALHNSNINLSSLKYDLEDSTSIAVRISEDNKSGDSQDEATANNNSLSDLSIGIIDYGMVTNKA